MKMKKIKKCQNCCEVDNELVEVEIAGNKKLFCDACADGYRIEMKINSSLLKGEESITPVSQG
jgi:hypothetical protein